MKYNRLIFSLLSLLLATLCRAEERPPLLPFPQHVEWTNTSFPLTGISLSIEENDRWIVEEWLAEAGIVPAPTASRQIRFLQVEALPEAKVNPDEAYRLEVTPQAITIEATTTKGFYWATQTLRQLTVREGNQLYVAGCRIVDYPAFRIRGFMHDVGRGYISLEELKREISLLARYKINVFHWHLTENQAWRLESKRFPMLNDSANMSRLPGKYYTHDEAHELMEYCCRHNMLLIPEIEMPGHSEAFGRTFRHDMQSPEGMIILKQLIDEACQLFAPLPYLHIGTDEVQFTNPTFVPEMVAYVRSKGKKVISWNPGWTYQPGEIDMLQMWSYRGQPHPGIPVIDSRLHYINHYDPFADVAALNNSNIAGQQQGSPDYAGAILALWNDRHVRSEQEILLQNAFYPAMLTLAERTWRGGKSEYFYTRGSLIDPPGSEEHNTFADFENRMLRHKETTFANQPFAYVRQANIHWRISDPFPNEGDLERSFPPEETLANSYTWQGKQYNSRLATGAAIYLRHVWGNTVPSFYKDPQPNHTAYAWTYVWSPRKQEAGLWANTQNYSRSEKDLPPPPGKWDYRESRIWLNDREVAPPRWTSAHREHSNEIPLGNENFEVRPPIPVTLQKGWNKVLIKLPVGEFTTPEVRLVKWMFTFALVTPDGRKEMEGLLYAPDKKGAVPVPGGKYSTYHRQRASLFELLPTTLDDILFVGNSITDGAEWAELLQNPRIKNRGISGDITQGIIDRLPTLLKGKPAKLFLMIGINDLALGEPVDSIINRTEQIIQTIKRDSPRTRIYLQSVLPVSDYYNLFSNHSVRGEEVPVVNAGLQQIARREQVTYIDLYSHFIEDETGKINTNYTNDGLHLTGAGYAKWVEIIKPYVTPLSLPAIYTDGMILQREKPLRIQGSAPPGEKITLTIGTQKHETLTAANGKWETILEPLSAGQSYTLVVSSSRQQLVINDIQAGEVWLCSGQSNMAFRVDESTREEAGAQLAYAASRPPIRFYDMKARWQTNAVEWEPAVMDSLNRLDYFRETRWQACDERNTAKVSAVAFAFARMLSDSLQIPVGLIINAVGGSPTEAWIDRQTLSYHFPEILTEWRGNELIQPWVRERAAQNIRRSTEKEQRHPYEPTYLFESGIQPLAPFPIRGVLWYQGESNAHNIEAHERLFPLVAKSWRTNWNEELPFYYVQLSSHNRPTWPLFRDSQRQLMRKIPHTGMAVSSDRGDSLDVHPRRKKEIGERLARWALADTYGRAITPSGPLVKKAIREGQSVKIQFIYAKGLTTSDGQPVQTVEIAATEGDYFPAEVTIRDSCLIVQSPYVQQPRYVRYGWQPSTRGNLVNAAGLPASTFRIPIDTLKTDNMKWSKLPDLPGTPTSPSLGVSAPFTGILNDQLIVAGGCNFPDRPATEGGTKRYYDEIFALDLRHPSTGWKIIGHLPQPVAYGATITLPEGIICIGGNNNERTFSNVCILTLGENDSLSIKPLPSLPAPVDNLAAAAIGKTIYIAGGNLSGIPSNALFSLDLANPEEGWQKEIDFPGPARLQPVLATQSNGQETRLYLAGGFQPPRDKQPAILPRELYSYSPSTAKWQKENTLPPLPDGTPRTLTGGCAIPCGNECILFLGGVNYTRFLQAIDRPRQLAEARESGDYTLQQHLDAEASAYMHHSPEWYRFNTTLLAYNTHTSTWHSLGDHPPLARAGAGAVLYNGNLIIINGELKPGIRTPEVNLYKINYYR